MSSFGITRGFILPNGDIAKNGTRHEDIAMEYLNQNPNLKKKYDKMGGNLCDFMVITLGALKVGSNSINPQVITYKDRLNIPKEFWAYIQFYLDKGYRIDVI